jgi:hypothetical protein
MRMRRSHGKVATVQYLQLAARMPERNTNHRLAIDVYFMTRCHVAYFILAWPAAVSSAMRASSYATFAIAAACFSATSVYVNVIR